MFEKLFGEFSAFAYMYILFLIIKSRISRYVACHRKCRSFGCLSFFSTSFEVGPVYSRKERVCW